MKILLQYVENPMAPNFVAESMSQTGFVRVRRLLLLLGGILLFIGLLFGLDQAELKYSNLEFNDGVQYTN